MLRWDGVMVVFLSMIVWISFIVVTMPRREVVRAGRTRDRRMSVLMIVAMEYSNRSCQ